jgi:predicted dehydrogenase
MAPPSERLRMGAIGLGPRGQFVLSHFLKEPDIQMVAVCDAIAERRSQGKAMVDQHYGNSECASYRRHEEILDRKDIDAVLIATGDRWHAVLSALAARAGKDIYCEKPFTLTIGEGRTLADTLERYGTVWQCGMQRRSDPGYHFINDVVRSGRLGKLGAITMSFGDFGRSDGLPVPEPEPDIETFDYNRWLGQSPWMPYSKLGAGSRWRVNWDLSGGVITDMGPHFCQIAQWIRGDDPPGLVEFDGDAAFYSQGEYNETPFFLNVRIRYPDGFVMVMDMDTKAMRFIGDQGWFRIYDLDGRIETAPQSVLRGLNARQTDWKLMQPHIRNFVECVKSRQQPVSSIDSAQKAHTIAHAANLCLRLGRKLRWNPETERFVDDEDANRMLNRTMRVPWRI